MQQPDLTVPDNQNQIPLSTNRTHINHQLAPSLSTTTNNKDLLNQFPPQVRRSNANNYLQ